MTGTLPSVDARKPPIGLRAGRRAKMPQNPYTTLGTAARRSTSDDNPRRRRSGAKLVMYNATETATGTARIMAINDVISVP